MASLLTPLFVQSLLSQHLVSYAHALALYTRARVLLSLAPSTQPSAAEARRARDEFDGFLNEVAQELSTVGLELRMGTRQEDGERVVALVNAKADGLAQIAAAFSAVELGFIRRLISAIFQAADEVFSLGASEALAIARRSKPPLRPRQAEEILGRLVGHGWLARSA